MAGLASIFFLNSFVANRLALGGATLSAWRLCLLAGAAAATYALIGNIGALAGGFTVAVLIDRLGRTAVTALSYTTFSELFPTELRATGIGVSVAAGRLGGMLGVVGLSYAVAGLISAFVILAVFSAIGTAAALIWGRRGGVEGRGLSLDAVAPVPMIT